MNVHCKDDVQETVIIDMTNFEDENPPLEGVRIPTKDISKAKSFCVRYYVESLKNQGIFTTPKGEMGLVLYLNYAQPLGFVLVQGKYLVFQTQQKTPYVYEHLCFSHNETHYFVVTEGKVLFSTEISEEDSKLLGNPLTDEEILIGPSYFNSSLIRYFSGKISEIYLFSNLFTDTELIEMTLDCKRIAYGNKVFDWSNLKVSDVKIPNGALIKTEMEMIDEVCSRRKSNQIALIPFAMNFEGQYFKITHQMFYLFQ